MRQLFWILSCAALIGCGAERTNPISATPAESTPGYQTDFVAAQVAQSAFADSARTYGRPAEAARAVIALEILARPQTPALPSDIQSHLLQGRAEARDALFVAPDTSSDVLVASLSAVVDALARNDQAAAVQALGRAIFTRPPEQVFERLSNMPYLRMANVSTTEAAETVLDGSDDSR